MKPVNKLQIGIIAGAVVLFVLLYFGNKKPVKKAEDFVTQSTAGTGGFDMEALAKSRIAMLNGAVKDKFNTLIKPGEDKTAVLDSLIGFWDALKQPDIAAVYTAKKASRLNTTEAWVLAGDRYFYSVGFVKDPNEKSMLYASAIRCYDKGLALNPNNVDAKINRAASYVDGTADPMKGISMLREIEKTDSNNVNLQLTFALFSAKSKQWEKAISRYEKVLKLKPDYLRAYLYMAEAYENKGDKVKTIESLEKFVSLSPDKDARQEIQKYINDLKK